MADDDVDGGGCAWIVLLVGVAIMTANSCTVVEELQKVEQRLETIEHKLGGEHE